MQPSLNIIGCGRLGRTLARLWHTQGSFRVERILTRSPHSAAQAIRFVGAGQSVAGMRAMCAADAWLIATPDDAIEGAACALAGSGLVRAGDLVFHCSGALPSLVLAPLAAATTRLASAHPLHSFADPARSVQGFAGTFCALEGDPQAVAMLSRAFTSIAAEIVNIGREGKLLYHAGSVIACNYLVALMDVALRSFDAAGIAPDLARRMLRPITRATLDNVLRHGPGAALTGPIARGDVALVEDEYAALGRLGADVADVYRALGLAAIRIARAQDGASQSDLDALLAALSR